MNRLQRSSMRINIGLAMLAGLALLLALWPQTARPDLGVGHAPTLSVDLRFDLGIVMTAVRLSL